MNDKRQARATPEFLRRLFQVPDDERATLLRLEKSLTENLNIFLKNKIVAGEHPVEELVNRFLDTRMPDQPEFVSNHVDQVVREVLPYCVHVGSPKFIGHMTSALPYFLTSLAKCMTGLHQNLVKIETSRSLTLLERQILGVFHRLAYQMDESFYQNHVQTRDSTLGIHCSGGTIANITALWIARNRFIQAHAPEAGQGDLIEAVRLAGIRGLKIYISQRGHYSLKKSADVLGLGHSAISAIPVDTKHRIDVKKLREQIISDRENGFLPLAIVGVAGGTETGSIDPLAELAEVAKEQKCHYHVDGAWGFPTLFSKHFASLVSGIERADTLTCDCHKQMYLPMGSAVLLLKDPSSADAITHRANYVIRESSLDLGKRSLEGSRPGMALLVNAALRVFGREGYDLIVTQNLQRARRFAEMINEHPDFELLVEPQLNILCYRFKPEELGNLDDESVSELNVLLQKTERERGQSFVSRTRVFIPERGRELAVLRAVLANPNTTEIDLQEILREQSEIGREIMKKAAENPA